MGLRLPERRMGLAIAINEACDRVAGGAFAEVEKGLVEREADDRQEPFAARCRQIVGPIGLVHRGHDQVLAVHDCTVAIKDN